MRKRKRLKNIKKYIKADFYHNTQKKQKKHGMQNPYYKTIFETKKKQTKKLWNNFRFRLEKCVFLNSQSYERNEYLILNLLRACAVHTLFDNKVQTRS